MLKLEYDIPGPDDLSVIGGRARRLRELLDMTIGRLANKAGVTEHQVRALENGGAVTLATTLAIHHVLSGDGAGENLFSHPRFRSIDEVVAYEKRRLNIARRTASVHRDPERGPT